VRGTAAVRATDEVPGHGAHGSQVVLDLYDCETPHLDDLPWVEATLMEAARVAGATIVQTVFHKFAPWGISGVVVISESHLAIHIWPENRYAAVDIFTCGESVRLDVASAFLKRAFVAGSAVKRSFTRGDRAAAAHRRNKNVEYGERETRAVAGS